jgi:hypothetical protein
MPFRLLPDCNPPTRALFGGRDSAGWCTHGRERGRDAGLPKAELTGLLLSSVFFELCWLRRLEG